jgi:hypothetical protein
MTLLKQNWLRWLALLPCALVGGFLMTFPLHWILYLAFAHNGTLLGFIELSPGANVPIEYALTPFVISLSFVLIGFEIAPHHKLKASITLAVLWFVAFFSALVYVQQLELGIRSIGSILGPLIALYIAWGNTHDKKGGAQTHLG